MQLRDCWIFLLSVLIIVCIESIEALPLSLIWAFPGAEYLHCMEQIKASLCKVPPWAENFPAAGTLQEHRSFSLVLSGEKSLKEIYFSPHSLTSSSAKQSQEDLFCNPVLYLHC